MIFVHERFNKMANQFFKPVRILFQLKKGVAGIEEMSPVSIETGPVPMERRPVPMETEVLWMEMSPVSMERKVLWMEMSPVSMERKVLPMETEPVPMEKGFISSLDFSVLRPETNNANILIN
jgi:hypothetical protein